MVIGVPKETHYHEHRVGLTPTATALLVGEGHTVLVEKEAGLAARFTDLDFQQAGAKTVFSRDEAYQRADIVARIGAVPGDELEHVRPGSVICAFHHLAVAPRENVQRLMEREVTLIGYEIIRDREGRLPVLRGVGEMAGAMAIQVAAHCLENESGGRGILLGNVPGVAPATVVVVGAGGVGQAAARLAAARGAHVIVLDSNLDKIRAANAALDGRETTVLAGRDRLERYVPLADVLIGCVLVPGARSPLVVTEDLVKRMKPGSVIVDVSIDQGGCVETSRPTTLEHPTYIVHGVVHYCVPNMTANIARTASLAISNAALPYLMSLAEKGVAAALQENPGLARGVYLYRGKLTSERAAGTLRFPVFPLDKLLGEVKKS